MTITETTATDTAVNPTQAQKYIAKLQANLDRARASREAVSQVHLRLMNAVRTGELIAGAIVELGTPSYNTNWSAPYNLDRVDLLDWLDTARTVFEWLADFPEFVGGPVTPTKSRYGGTHELLALSLSYGSERFGQVVTLDLEAEYTPRDQCQVVPTGEKVVKTIEVTKTECIPGDEAGAAWEALGLAQPAVLDASKLAAA